MKNPILENILNKITRISPFFGPKIFQEIISDRNLNVNDFNMPDIIKIIKTELNVTDIHRHPVVDMLLSVDVAFFQFDRFGNFMFTNDYGESLAIKLGQIYGEPQWQSHLWIWFETLELIRPIEKLAYKINVRQLQVTEWEDHSFNLTQVPLLDAKKAICGTILILQDISLNENLYLQTITKKIELYDEIGRRESLEKRLADNQLTLMESEKLSSLGVMASHIAHELLNPLSVAIVKLDSLKRAIKNENKDSINDNLGKIEKVLGRIGQIIKGLRSFSRKDEQDPFVRTNFREILEDTLLICSEQLRTKKITLTMDGDFSVNLSCRAGQISQVLMNLVRNSIDAIEGTPQAWIKIEGRPCTGCPKHCLEVIVTDSGKGIPEEVLVKLMTPFFTTKAAGKGTGVGLNLSRRICDDHGGSLNYKLHNGHTAFVINLPVELVSP